jgi:hypothetical protein
MWRALLPAITAIAYLISAAMPCPPSAELLSAASHGSHDHAGRSEESASLTAPCPCGCDPGAVSFSVAKRAETAVGVAPTPTPLAVARSFARERTERLPDAPISVESPVPIAA